MRIDYIYHLLAGFIISTILNTIIPIGVVFLIVMGIGILKEFYDKFIKKTYSDWKDTFFTIAGGFFGCWLDYVKTII